MDEALSLPTETAARIALRTQQVIAHESGVADIVDAFAGSYAIEELTNKLEQKAVDYIQKIDDLGGMLRAIEQGYPQREIQEAAYQYQKAVETKDAVVVGGQPFSNRGKRKDSDYDRSTKRSNAPKVERLQALRSRRDKEKADNALTKLEDAARGTENLLPRILDCVENYVTVGEISNALRKIWGEYREAVTV
jgi:methylmalonyl-CoA mutase N-terminal domain/subunit